METADTLTTHLKHERTQARERSPAQSCRAGDKTWYPGRTSQAALHTCEASSACLQRNPGEDGLTEGRAHRHLTANSPPEQSLRPAFLTGRVRPHRSAVFRSTASTWPFAGCCICHHLLSSGSLTISSIFPSAQKGTCIFYDQQTQKVPGRTVGLRCEMLGWSGYSKAPR